MILCSNEINKSAIEASNSVCVCQRNIKLKSVIQVELCVCVCVCKKALRNSPCIQIHDSLTLAMMRMSVSKSLRRSHCTCVCVVCKISLDRYKSLSTRSAFVWKCRSLNVSASLSKAAVSPETTAKIIKTYRGHALCFFW